MLILVLERSKHNSIPRVSNQYSLDCTWNKWRVY